MLHPVFHTLTTESPVGPLTLMASDRGLLALQFSGGKHAALPADVQHSPDHPLLLRAVQQLQEYFDGKRRDFTIPLDLRGTIFQLKAWRELQAISYGQTISYADQARAVGDVNKARAVGIANGRNPVAIIVPCHRVIGSSGALTGYAGGLHIKSALLELEARVSGKAQSSTKCA